MLNLFTEVSELLPQVPSIPLSEVSDVLSSGLQFGQAGVPIAIAIAVVLNFVVPTR